MTNKSQPSITLVNGGEYITREGTTVKMSVNNNCGMSPDYPHQFLGSNGFYYKTNGSIFSDEVFDLDAVSEYKEPQVQPKSYTAKELLSAMSDSYNNGKSYGRIFSTSELQSLTKMQSKVIAALEADIIELKETAAYLGNCTGLVNRVNGLRKQIFNEITTKKKRLVKLVALQARMKRSK